MSAEILRMNFLWDDINALSGDVGGVELFSLSIPVLMASFPNHDNRVVVVGDAGIVLLYDGTTWVKIGHIYEREDFLCHLWARDIANIFFPVSNPKKKKLATLQHFNANRNDPPRPVLTAPQNIILYRVSGHGNSIFVCGSDGFFAYYNGSQWSDFRVPGQKDLMGVEAISAKEAYVVGQGGFVGKFNGQKIVPLDGVEDSSDLMALTVVNEHTFVVGGKSGQIWVYSNEHPQPSVKPDSDEKHLYAACSNGRDVVFVGEDNSVVHFNGRKWSKINLKMPDKPNSIPYQLNHVCFTPQGSLMAVGGKRKDRENDIFYAVVAEFQLED